MCHSQYFRFRHPHKTLAGQPNLLRTEPALKTAVVHWGLLRYIPRVNRLTRQEQFVLCVVIVLLLVGWAVKAYRTAHPPTALNGLEKSP